MKFMMHMEVMPKHGAPPSPIGSTVKTICGKSKTAVPRGTKALFACHPCLIGLLRDCDTVIADHNTLVERLTLAEKAHHILNDALYSPKEDFR